MLASSFRAAQLQRLSVYSNCISKLTASTTSHFSSRSLNLIDSIGWFLSITVGPILPGEGIRQYFARQDKPVPLPQRLRWVEQITASIAFVHSRNVMHGDSSCNNVSSIKSLTRSLATLLDLRLTMKPLSSVMRPVMSILTTKVSR